MAGYIIRRIGLLIPTLLLVTIIVFLTVRLMPGSVVDTILSNMGFSNDPPNREAIIHALGLDVPVLVQYKNWMVDVFVHGNLGTSLRTGQSVSSEVIARLPVTFELSLLSFLIAVFMSLPIGIYSAIRQDTWIDFTGRSIAIFFLAAPGFWLASVLIVFGGRFWSWSPSIGYVPFYENPIENMKMFLIPAFFTGMASAGAIMRGLRTITLEVVRQDYIRTAWAKGLRERVVILRHAMRNSLIPMVTMLVPQLGAFIGGSVIMEQIFAIPGMGRYLLTVITQRDYLAVSGTNLLFAGFTMILVLLTDLSYAWLDPRVRYK